MYYVLSEVDIHTDKKECLTSYDHPPTEQEELNAHIMHFPVALLPPELNVNQLK